MGKEVGWRDMKAECPPSSTLGTFTGTLVSLVGQLGTEHRTLLSKHEPNLFPSRQYLTKRIYDEMQTAHYNTLRFSVLIASVQGKNGMQMWSASIVWANPAYRSISRSKLTIWTSPSEMSSARG